LLKAPKFWFSSSLPSKFISWSLWPVSFIYTLAFKLKFKSHTAYKASIPVICIGNLVAGGAGKTPLVLWLAKALIKRGHTPHVILRGYGGQQKSTHRVNSENTAREVGDEALLYANTYATWVGGDRVSSAKAAVKAGATILLMDDGFQNPSLYKNYSILVINQKTLLGNEFVLPAGPLREPISFALPRCQAVLFMGRGPISKKQLKFDGLVINASLELLPDEVTWLENKKLIAFSGIGTPEKFFETLSQSKAEICEAHAFPDHHFFTEKNFAFLTQRLANFSEHEGQVYLVTTSKDYVRLPTHMKKLCRQIHVEVAINDEEVILSQLQNHIA